jgi:hypothetical protein
MSMRKARTEAACVWGDLEERAMSRVRRKRSTNDDLVEAAEGQLHDEAEDPAGEPGVLHGAGAGSVAVGEGDMGCPHDQGEDFPDGEDCPFCPFWAGKQGSNRRD